MFLCNVLARFVKAEINSKPILWVLLLGLLVLSSSNVSSERLSGDKRATVCMQSGSLSIKCPGGHIEIQNAFYTHATDCSKTAESGSCDQYSIEASIQLSTACNDKPSCSFQPPSIGEINGRTLDGSIIDANPPQCGQGGKIALGRFPTNAFGATYKCKEYSICSAMNTTAAGLRLRTEYFPELVTTNPTCECTYAAETGYTLELLMSCTGAVAVVTEEYYNGMSKPITRNYYCEDSRKDSLREYVGSRLSNEEVDSGAANAGMLPHKIGFKVEISRSSETSSYEIIPTLFTSVGSRAPKEAKALISCVDGGLYLRYSVRIALYITIPLVVIIIIALIVVRCLFKRRRVRKIEKRREQRRLFRISHEVPVRPENHEGASPVASPTTESRFEKPPIGLKPVLGLQTAGSQHEHPQSPQSPPAVFIPSPLNYQPAKQYPTPQQQYQPPKQSYQPQVDTHHYVEREGPQREIIELPVVKPKKPATPKKDKLPKLKKEKTPKKKQQMMERLSPDGSDSEEDITNLARQLHLQNELRKQQLFDKRAGFNRGGSPRQSRRSTPPRTHSFGTLPATRYREEIEDSEEEFSQPRRGNTLSGSRSASNSRTNLRPRRRPPPPPPPGDLYAPVHKTRNSTSESPGFPPPQPIYANPQSLAASPGPANPIYTTPEINVLNDSDTEMDIQRSKKPLLPPKPSDSQATRPAKPHRQPYQDNSMDY